MNRIGLRSHPEVTGKVDTDDDLDGLMRALLKGLPMDQSGVVNEDVHRTQISCHGCAKSSYIVYVGDVHCVRL